jgi:hypothetical protein
MKRIVIASPAIAALALLVSCASVPIEKPVVTKENRPMVMDDQYHGTRETPDWIFMEPKEMEGTGQYKDVYLFKVVQQGMDIDGLRAWASGFVAPSDIARTVSIRVQDKFVGAAAGDKNKLETYMEEVVKSVSQAQYSGAKKTAEYWWQIQKANADGTISQVFEYYMLYTVPKDQIDQAIKRAIDEAANAQPPKTEDETTARDRVKAAMGQGLN